MRKYILIFTVFLVAIATAHAQDKPSGKTLAATLDVYVFPKKGQTPDQQSKDEAECFDWAVTNTGSDPFKLKKQSVAQAEEGEKAKAKAAQTGKGAGAAGAVGGAAAGAIIGEIVDDDAGKGAAIGATVGAIRGRRRARKGQQQATAKAEQESQGQQKATEEQIVKFKKAFSACLEAKGYMVKF